MGVYGTKLSSNTEHLGHRITREKGHSDVRWLDCFHLSIGTYTLFKAGKDDLKVAQWVKLPTKAKKGELNLY